MRFLHKAKKMVQCGIFLPVQHYTRFGELPHSPQQVHQQATGISNCILEDQSGA